MNKTQEHIPSDDAFKQLMCETARQMKADGLPVARICKYTGLSAEEVARL